MDGHCKVNQKIIEKIDKNFTSNFVYLPEPSLSNKRDILITRLLIVLQYFIWHNLTHLHNDIFKSKAIRSQCFITFSNYNVDNYTAMFFSPFYKGYKLVISYIFPWAINSLQKWAYTQRKEIVVRANSFL